MSVESQRKTCPSTDRLQALLTAQLPPAEQEEITRHVDACTACQKNLDALSPAGKSWEDLAAHFGKVEVEPEPALERVMHQAKGPAGADRTEAEQKSTPDVSRTHGQETQAERSSPPPSDELSFLNPPTTPAAIGRLAHYEVHKLIGKGGFGLVLKGFDERLHRAVAIKALSPAYAANGSARKRFIRKARAAAAVKNEHIVGIYDVQEDANPPFLVMELIDGISLQDKLDKRGPLEVKEILRIGMQMAEGLAAAHKQGLVHRDIKPANILLENGVERVKITDFGLARAVDDASVMQSGTVTGTPMYMSPEQAEGLAVDHRSDLFSLGTVLYTMCTGHPPFRASGTHAVLKRVIDASPRPMHEFNPEIPEWLEAIVAKLHAKKPEERVQTAQEVAELLGQRLADVQAGRAISALPSSAGSGVRGASSAPRRRRWAVRAACAALILAAAWWFGPTIVRLLLNRGDLEIDAQDGLVSAIVLQNDLTVTDWLDVKTAPSMALSPGKYQLNFGVAPGYRMTGWELTASGLFGKRRHRQPSETCVIDVQRERVTIRALVQKVPGAVASEKPPDSTGWRRLFNGKDLTGWVPVYDKAKYKTSPWDGFDNVITLKGQSVGYLRTKKKYREFHLRFEYRAVPESPQDVFHNSAVLWGVQEPDDPAKMPVSARLELVRGKGGKAMVGTVYSSNGIVPGITPKNIVGPAAPEEAWIPSEIISKDGTLEIRNNGVSRIISDYQPFDGYLGLHSDKQGLRVRNLEIRELLPAAVLQVRPSKLSAAEWKRVISELPVIFAKELTGTDEEKARALGLRAWAFDYENGPISCWLESWESGQATVEDGQAHHPLRPFPSPRKNGRILLWLQPRSSAAMAAAVRDRLAKEPKQVPNYFLAIAVDDARTAHKAFWPGFSTPQVPLWFGWPKADLKETADPVTVKTGDQATLLRVEARETGVVRPRRVQLVLKGEPAQSK